MERCRKASPPCGLGQNSLIVVMTSGTLVQRLILSPSISVYLLIPLCSLLVCFWASPLLNTVLWSEWGVNGVGSAVREEMTWRRAAATTPWAHGLAAKQWASGRASQCSHGNGGGGLCRLVAMGATGCRRGVAGHRLQRDLYKNPSIF